MSETEPVSTNNALTIQIGDSSFHPLFTYPIFGDKESLVGYLDPKIHLEFHPRTMRPLLIFESKLKDDDAIDPVEVLQKFLPEGVYTERAEWEAATSAEAETFRPPGIRQFEFDNFEVYKTNLSESVEFLRRVRPFVLFFIEAGSYIDEEDSRWEIYLVFEKDTGNFVGFTTVYPYFYYETGTIFDETAPGQNGLVRKRISQFLILPPYQRGGLGQNLFNGLTKLFVADSSVREITVEDPNEAFDEMRDRADLTRFEADSTLDDLALPIEQTFVKELLLKHKMPARQLERTLELLLLKKDPTEPKEYRKFVKERLWQRNFESLQSLDAAQQREAINQTYESVVEGYKRTLGLTVDEESEGLEDVGEENNVEPLTKKLRHE